MDGWIEQSAVDKATNELKNQAAKTGAHGVFLSTAGEDTIYSCKWFRASGCHPRHRQNFVGQGDNHQ